jgi:hypothetical protein
MPDFGLQFSPASSMSRQQNGAGNGDPNQGVQEAIRTLSLRVPRVSGAQGFSPLINAPGSEGLARPGGMTLEQLLLQIFGNQRPQGAQGTFAPQGQAPASVKSYGPVTPSIKAGVAGGGSQGPVEELPEVQGPGPMRQPPEPSKFMPEIQQTESFY